MMGWDRPCDTVQIDFCDLDKYHLQFGQIQFAIWPNPIWNLDLDNLEFVTSKIVKESCVRIHQSVLNGFCKLNQILFAV